MGQLDRAQRLFHTLRHLYPVQIYGRIWFRLYRPRPDLRPAPPLRERKGKWCAPTQRPANLSGPMRFIFLNETHELSSSTDWNNPAWEKLWLYNLHYFDDLNAEGNELRQDWHRALIQRWIDENPPRQGNGWEPYPLSLRIVNWIKWALSGNRLEAAWLHSLAVQTRYLARRLEYHLLGNHLFANAKALVFAGLFFDGPEARGWRETGLKILHREVPEQTLADGGHFERSPMYHGIILEDLLDLLNLAQVYPGMIEAETVQVWRSKVQAMFDWLNCLCHPDGEIGLFNDAAFKIAPSPGALRHYANRLGLPVEGSGPEGLRFLEASGYARLALGPAVVLADVGAVGPDYLPGHAHADTLSFELSLYGQRVIVDSGTSCYGLGEERQRQRSTAAHNTLMIDGCDSSEVWGGFRVARRARVVEVSLDDSGDLLMVTGSQDGYQRLPGRPIHGRQWLLNETQLRITDEVKGDGEHEIEFALHLHPDYSAWLEDGVCRVTDRRSGRKFRIEFDPTFRVELADSTYHPEFGLSIVNRRLSGLYRGRLPVRFETFIRWGDE